MEAAGRRLGLLLGAGALIVGLLLWLLMRGDAVQRDDAPIAVLKGDRADVAATSPAVPAPRAPSGTPESLVVAAPHAPSDEPADAAADALPGAAALFTGRVVDERGAPIADAIVWHVPTRTLRRPLGFVTGRSGIDLAWELLPQTSTDAEGRFSFTSRELARDPEASPDPAREGYLHGVYGGDLPGLVVRHPAFAIVVHPCASFRSAAYDAGDIVLSPGGELTGRLLSTEGGVVVEASVGPSRTGFADTLPRYGDFYVARHFLQVLSGADGRFLVGSLWPGQVELEVQHGDFVPLTDRATSTAGEVFDLGDLELEPARHIRGIVLDVEGQPLRGALLLARGSAQRMEAIFGGADPLQQEIGSSSNNPGKHEVRLTADADGAFDLGTLNQTYYDVFADLPGHEATCARDVQAGTDDVVLRLAREATLLLSVVAASDRAPLAGATARAWRLSDVKSIFGGSLGSEIQVVAGREAAAAAGLPGDGVGLLLVQRAGDDGTDVVVSAPGHATTGFALPGVRPGQRLERTLDLAREAVLEGRVQNAAHEPIAGASVTLSRPADAGLELPARTATSDAEGRFRLDALLPGTWSLWAGAKDYLEARPTPLTVTDAAEQPEAVITLLRGAALKGLLLDADGAPAADVTLELTITSGDWAGRQVQATSSSSGRFSWEGLPPGPVIVRAWPGVEADLTLVAGETAEVTLALRHQPAIRGRVTRGGQPVGMAKVVAVLVKAAPSPPTAPSFFHSGDGSRHAGTTATGEYELSTTTHGSFFVQAQAGRTRSRAVMVTADWDREAFADLDFGSARIAGLVTDARTAQPIAGAELGLHDRAIDAEGALAGFKRGAELDQTATTDAEGRFAFEQLQPGAFVVKVRATGYADASHEVQLAADDTLTLDGAASAGLVFALEPGVRLKGTLRMASGKLLYPDLCIGLETAGHPAQKNYMQLSAAAPSVKWTWSMPLAPGPCTLKVWRAISTSVGDLAEKDVLVTASASLVAGETRVVDLVIFD